MIDGPDEQGIIIHDGVIGGDEDFDNIPEQLPVLPLNDVVLFPGMVIPLVVDTKRSIKLVDSVISGSQFMITALQRNHAIPDDQVEEADLYEHGCQTRVLKMLKFPDDTVRVLVQGLSRCRMTSFVGGHDFLVARYDVLNDSAEDSLEIEALARNASQRFLEVITMSPTLPEELKVAVFNADNPGQLSDIIASNLNMTLKERQMLLKSARPRIRLKRLTKLLNREREVLRLGTEIQNKVSETFNQNQRETILREQLKAIQTELGELDQQQVDNREIEEKVLAAGLPPDVLAVANKERKRLLALPTASPEYGVIRTYLDWITELPWSKTTDDRLDIEAARRVLDKDHYDLVKIKDRILEFLAVLKLKQNLKGPILCLAGPPGVGKTSLGQSIARALGRKFIHMSLGGVRDEAEIRGHRRTYIGALPGRIIQGLRNAGTCNPVFMLDEIDKLGSDFRGDPSSALLEVLDPEQNNSFSDHYLDVPFDLSRVLFITTANVTHTIPPALLDRMEVLQLSGYTQQEKLQIARKYLVPKQIRAHGLKRSQIALHQEAIKKVIQGYTREAGVRNMEREIANLCRKTARHIATGGRKVTIDAKQVRSFLGPPRFEAESAESQNDPGVATGLAWTPTGGDILFIEVTRMEGKGQLILTGSLGDVMKESARTALSYVQSRAEQFGIREGLLDKADIHIHVPSGAIPKDGPSAGVAIATALVSLVTERSVAGDLAMTGEISLRGKVMPVGGVKEKVLAAARAGIKRIILPEKNRVDLEDVPPEIRKSLRFKYVSRIDEAVRYALRKS